MSKTKIIKFSFLILFSSFLILPQFSFAQELGIAGLKISGKTEGTGNYFEITDSRYLNIILESSAEIKTSLESIPRMISLNIEAVSAETATATLTLRSLESNKTYYFYQDSYQNGAVFISDESGKITWEQDLTQSHHVWLQETESTIFITEDTVLTADLTESVEIAASNITLDCAGHSITGPGTGYGIYVSRKTNVAVKNCNISNFATGIYLLFSDSNNNLLDNNISSSQMSGITLRASSLNNVQGNTLISNNPYGILLERDYDTHGNPIYSNNNSIIENNVSFSRFGIDANNSQQNTISDNTVSNITEWAITGSGSLHQIERNIITDSHGGLYIFWSLNGSYADNEISSSDIGINFSYSSGNTLRNNMLSNNTINLFFHLSDITPEYTSQDIDTSNTIDGKPIYYLVNETDREISGEAGFVGLINSTNITVKDLTLTNNWLGILLSSTTNSTIENNNISNNRVGVFAKSSLNNTFVNNTIKDNQDGGVSLNNSSENVFYHNNFINNTGTCSQLGIWPITDINILNEDYPEGGNYWSDYTGVDLKSGAGQDQDGADGIGDTPQFVKYYSDGICLNGQRDRYPWMTENGWAAQPPAEKWSFAIITDLHIGRGYGDYGTETFEDDIDNGDYYLTERLKKVVDWIINNKGNVDCSSEKCPIQFLAVLGDITNTAEKSQFLKAQEILDRLNDPNGDGDTLDGIPYVPVFGNHDVWPYSDKGEAASSLGEIYFDDIFWDENATNTKLMEERLNFQRDDINTSSKNFAFSYKDMNFIGLDFDSRSHIPSPALETGVYAAANAWDTTLNWLKDCLQDNEKCLKGSEANSNIIFSHHPLVGNLAMGFSFGPSPLPNELDDIRQIIENENVIASFAGHIHEFYDWWHEDWMNANKEYPSVDITKVITTESLMVGSNEENPKGIIRIVKVSPENQINYDNWETTEGTTTEFIGLNPYMELDYTSSSTEPCMVFKGHAYTKRDTSFLWEIDGQAIGSGEKIEKCFPEAVESSKTYDIKLTTVDNRKPDEKETLGQKIEVEAGIIAKLLKINEEAVGKIELMSISLWEDLTNFGRTVKDKVLIMVKHSPAKPAGLITIHFEEATSNIDLTNLMADIDLTIRKSILYMPQWPNVIEQNKVLFIAK